MKQSALRSVFIFRGRVIGLDYYKSKEFMSRVVKLQVVYQIGLKQGLKLVIILTRRIDRGIHIMKWKYMVMERTML